MAGADTVVDLDEGLGNLDLDQDTLLELDGICSRSELGKYIDEHMKEINVEDEVNKSLNVLNTQVRQQESKYFLQI